MDSLVNYERDGAVSVLTMDDGKMNVMSCAMLGALNAALDRAQADGTVVLIAGRENVFSAGFDLAVFKQGRAQQIEMLSAGARLTERLLSFPAPVVAAVGGHAIAMGLFIVLCSDLRIGVSNAAFKLQANEVAIGMTVPRFATEVCRQRLTPAHFSRALTTAEPCGPEQAVQAGFLDELAPADQLLAAARAKAAAMAKLVRESHVATKLRVRGDALQALRRGIEADIADWNSRPG